MIRVPEDGELDLLPTLLLRGLGATGGGGLRLDLAEREGDLDWTGVTGDPRLLERHSDPCLLYTSPSPRDATLSRMPSSA